MRFHLLLVSNQECLTNAILHLNSKICSLSSLWTLMIKFYQVRNLVALVQIKFLSMLLVRSTILMKLIKVSQLLRKICPSLSHWSKHLESHQLERSSLELGIFVKRASAKSKSKLCRDVDLANRKSSSRAWQSLNKRSSIKSWVLFKDQSSSSSTYATHCQMLSSLALNKENFQLTLRLSLQHWLRSLAITYKRLDRALRTPLFACVCIQALARESASLIWRSHPKRTPRLNQQRRLWTTTNRSVANTTLWAESFRIKIWWLSSQCTTQVLSSRFRVFSTIYRILGLRRSSV